MSTNGLIDMTREPWDPERFAKYGCLAQLIDGPCNGEVVQFFPGKKVLEIRLLDTKPKFTEQELTKASTPYKTEEYELRHYSTEKGGLGVMGIWTGSKSGSYWRRLLDDAKEFRQLLKGGSGSMATLLAEYSRRNREQAERIKVLEALLAKPETTGKFTTEAGQGIDLTDVKLLPVPAKTIDGIFKKLYGKKPKQDTPAPKEDTGDGTYSTSA